MDNAPLSRLFVAVTFVVLPHVASLDPLPAADSTAAQPVVIEGVPHVYQKPDFCGEACAASWLQKIGIDADQDDVFDASGLDPALGRGCYTKELAVALARLGLDVGSVRYRIPADLHAKHLQALWNMTLADLRDGVPSIVCMRTSDRPTATEHFRLILGYDPAADEVIYHEPADRQGAYQRMPRGELLRLWPLKYDPQQWLAIRFAMRMSRPPVIAVRDDFTAADYCQHVMKLNSRLPSDKFTVLIEPPFVVIGDEAPEQVRQRAVGTVRWATTRLKSEYFARNPDQILDIWLFQDKASYDAHALRLFGEKPSTPYGYYSSVDRALVMNIATGGGTLVHEIVHPFIEANFSKCPAWFNEGLGSLYEQSSSRENRIIGLTNWRLAGLQRAIERDEVPSFRVLCSTTTHQFYRQDPGTNYAQARYLCFYLQEHDLLHKFYHEFVANHAVDPSGYATLQQTLGTQDMDKFQQQWEDYVLKLRFE